MTESQASNAQLLALEKAESFVEFRLASTHLKMADRLRLAPIVGLFNRLEAIPRRSRETDVLNKQFAWWLDAIRATKDGFGEHPELLAVKELISSVSVKRQEHLWQTLTDYVTFLATSVDGCRLEDRLQWQTFATQRKRPMLEFMAEAVGESVEETWMIPAANILTCVDLTRHFPQDVAHGLFLWPLDMVTAQGLEPEDLVSQERTPAKDSFWVGWESFAQQQHTVLQETFAKRGTHSPFAEFLVIFTGLGLQLAFDKPIDPISKSRQAISPWLPWKQLFRTWRLRTHYRQLEKTHL